MATALQSALKLTPTEFVDTVRATAQQLAETAQATFEQKQKEGRLVLSKQVLKGAERVNELSKALVLLSAKIAPAAPRATRTRAAAKPAARKTAVKRTAKPRARKAA